MDVAVTNIIRPRNAVICPSKTLRICCGAMRYCLKSSSHGGGARAGTLLLGGGGGVSAVEVETPSLLLSTRKGLPHFVSPDMLPSLPSPDSRLLHLSPFHLYV
ncbi:hypothetical protein MLD38_017721 [Melastoma candidum]|uniref:Uncharacterized protein n=1 Tax=Melastoma candidum TaxID=119954 RepID=A0ACB9QUN6_9MYRT|nr:hypothetical protein MLD38_017721 [Melastoma candidum]